MPKSEPIKGPWFLIAPNNAGATVTVGDPKGVTVSVDLDEGELDFLLPVVDAWLKANDEEPFEDWVWDAKEGVCRPADPQKLDEERERLAERGVKISFETPWFRLYREGVTQEVRGVPKLGIRTGLKDARKVDLTEEEVGGILATIYETSPSEPDYGGGPLTIPLIERVIFDMTPPGGELKDSHPIKRFGGDRPWAHRRSGLLMDEEVMAISKGIDQARALILEELGIVERSPSERNEQESGRPANSEDIEPSTRVEASVVKLGAFNKSLIEDPYRRFDDAYGPYGIVIPWFRFGDGSYKLSVTVFANGRPALTLSGPVPADAEAKAFEKCLDSAGFERMPGVFGEFVWMRARPEFDKTRRWDTKGKRVDKIDSEWGMLIKAFGAVALDQEVRLSDIVTMSDVPWPKCLDNGKAAIGRIKTIEAFQPLESDEGVYRSLFEYLTNATGRVLPWWDEQEDEGTELNRVLLRRPIKHTADPDEIIGLVKVASVLYAESLFGCGDVKYRGRARKAIRYADIGRYLTDLSGLLAGDDTCWDAVLEAFDDIGDIAFRLMGAALYEKACFDVGIQPEFVSRERLPEYAKTEPDDPFFSMVGDLRRNAEIINRLIDRCQEVEAETSAVVRSLGLAIKGGRSAFIDTKEANRERWAMAVSAAKDTLLESEHFGQGSGYRLGNEKEVFSKPTVDLRLAWDCLWIWLEATQKWPTSTATNAKKATFIGFFRLVRDAVGVVEELKMEETDEDNLNDGVNPAKKAMAGFLIQEQWDLTPPHVQAANPLNAPDSRFLAYGVREAGPAGWYPRERASQATNLSVRIDPDIRMRKARERYIESFGGGKSGPERKKEEA